MSTLEARFWSKVDRRGPDDCWPWLASKMEMGHGHIWIRKGVFRAAHRVSWEVNRGPIPDGLHVLHSCDNPPCVNPDHLRLGTNRDNIRDKVERGRSSWVGRRSKLTWDEVRDIRRRARYGNHAALALEFGVSRSLVSMIAEGKRWPEPPLWEVA